MSRRGSGNPKGGAPMNWELDWPVGRAGAAVVSPSGTETAFLGGVTGGDEFEVASVTKLTTSLAALAAVSSGRLDLDQPVPEAVNAGGSEGVTVRHLLAHAGGFPFEPPGRPRPPGQRRIYSNVGFRLLADAVADAAGVSFPTWLSSSVLDPLGMSATRPPGPPRPWTTWSAWPAACSTGAPR